MNGPARVGFFFFDLNPTPHFPFKRKLLLTKVRFRMKLVFTSHGNQIVLLLFEVMQKSITICFKQIIKKNHMTYKKIVFAGLITSLGMFSQRSFCQIAVERQSAKELIPVAIVNSTARLKSFSAKYRTGKVYLKWTIRNKTKDGTYIIERSDDGMIFRTIGIQQGLNTLWRKNITYYFVDTDSLDNSPCYYRIKHFAINNSLYTSRMVVMKE